MDPWRLILSGKGAAAYNMAVDEAILTACASGDAPPTVRIYDWLTPSVSLGYFQNVERSRIDLGYCEEQGVSLVRRPTGGRAVLHGHDVTFSVIVEEWRIPAESKGVLGSHVWIMGGIVRAFELLGVRAFIGPCGSDSKPTSSGDCFAHVAECDVRWDGGKAAGAAQLRRSGVLLEQGSIPRTVPTVDHARVFGARGRHGAESSLPLGDLSKSLVEEAVVQGCAQNLGIVLQPDGLSDIELRLADQLAERKYAASDWTFRRSESVDNGMLSCYTGEATGRGERCHA